MTQDNSAEEVFKLYKWIDEIPLSRPKRNISRDFSDGVLVAEIIAHYFPRIVELHNYCAVNSIKQKAYNWQTLNERVFKRLNFCIRKDDLDRIISCERYAIENFLKLLKVKLAAHNKNFPDQAHSEQAKDGEPSRLRKLGRSAGDHCYYSFSEDKRSSVKEDSSRARHPNYALQPTFVTQQQQTATIVELTCMNEILEKKVQKLEQLVRLKEAKIQALVAKKDTA
mmetsp:Transcript_20780/g.70732  ORF Transcript_20780/g.70732 Transcript_20780/m.70732 type:complete len:225 (+) Transcript_20780:172-846(+)